MVTNLFSHFPISAQDGKEETFELLLTRPDIRIERIISTGQASPPGFWYSQPRSEWVTVLQGSAGLKFENETEVRVINSGDFVNIPALCRHRVEWTSADEPTVWLAIHYGEETQMGEGEV
ncbi:cupin domain-containing protein [Rahnella woolbedingensis]|uniref:Cupin domain-containing protein n=1 Tax=Rahnella woolbedingensis TaxID=1510574 RepID=A0A419N909_9GAMM|nr:cupin domain-containing protein [Rahnella woolbedingensis]RJT43993.1 cupin domain-containing protein [Rahnella woolbedingensis]